METSPPSLQFERRPPKRRHVAYSWLPALTVCAMVVAYPVYLTLPVLFKEAPVSQRILESGKLRVLTVSGALTYLPDGPNGASGLEYDLLVRFAKRLGVALEIEAAADTATLLPRLLRGDAHLVAAGLSSGLDRKNIVFSEPIYEIKYQVVYLRGASKPRRLSDLVGRHIEVVARSDEARRLATLRAQYPGLKWKEARDKDAEQLLVEVWEGLIPYTIADSITVATVRQHYPELQIAFDLSVGEPVAWAFPARDHEGLPDLADAFIRDVQRSGELKRLLEHYAGMAGKGYNYANLTEYRRRIGTTLPAYEALFKDAGHKQSLDWKLLAALSYQESQWNPKAVSPTGARGLMQLTGQSATHTGVTDREDALQSVAGGARILREFRDQLPERIPEPDRTWMALAAYNVGVGHVLDARALAKKAGRNPDHWTDLQDFLLTLSDPEVAKTTKHGAARGGEAVALVNRVRTYHNVLVKLERERTPTQLARDYQLDLRVM